MKQAANAGQWKEGEKMNIGTNIRRVRKEKGISQTQLAQQLQISQSMLCQIERGTKVPSLPLGIEIAAALGCSLDRLTAERPGA